MNDNNTISVSPAVGIVIVCAVLAAPVVGSFLLMKALGFDVSFSHVLACVGITYGIIAAASLVPHSRLQDKEANE